MTEDAEIQALEARVAALEAKGKSLEGGSGEEAVMYYGMKLMADGEDPVLDLDKGGKGMFAWNAEKRQIGAGTVMVGRTAINLAASSEGLGDYTWAIRVTFGENGDSAEFFQYDGEQPTDTTTYLPLYTIQDGAVVTDRRG